MPYKPGGGGLPELYDPENGQYTDEEKNKLFNEELSNMIKRYIFGNTNTYQPRYPILGFHTDEYCELYVKYAIYDLYRLLPYEKIEYLLTYTDKNDKSLFFNHFGYESNIKGRNELFIQIMNGSDFSKMKFQKFNKYGLFVKVPTEIYNKKDGKNNLNITTIWKYEKDKKFHFITAIPKKMED